MAATSDHAFPALLRGQDSHLRLLEDVRLMFSGRAYPVTEATYTNVSPLWAQIYRAGQARALRPACDFLRHTLVTRAHVAPKQADQTLPVHKVPVPLVQEVEIAGKPGLASGAGWEPVVQHLWRAEGQGPVRLAGAAHGGGAGAGAITAPPLNPIRDDEAVGAARDLAARREMAVNRIALRERRFENWNTEK